MRSVIRVMLCAAVIATLVVGWLQPAGAFGELDPSFATNGVFGSGLPLTDLANDVAVDANGQIVVAGKLEVTAGNFDIMVLRLNTNGTFDTTFDGDGIATASLASLTEEAVAVVTRSDGTIVVAAKTGASGSRNFGVVRFLSNGTRDPAFGGGDGIVTTDLGGDDVAADLFVQGAGEPVVVGSTASNFAVVRYTSAGVPDTTFGGGDGIVTTDIAGGVDAANAVAPTSDFPQKIVVAGSAVVAGTATDFAVARYTSTGTLDTAFSTDGKATVAFGGATTDVANSVRITPVTGKVVLAGTANPGDAALARLTAAGALDTTFSTDGKVTTDLGGIDEGNDLIALPNGHTDGPIILLGNTGGGSGGAVVARYLPNGALDTNYSGDGKVTVTSVLVAQGVAMQSDGKLVIAGQLGLNTEVARLQPTTSADLSLSSSHSFDTPRLGGLETYTEAVTNNGPTPAIGATLTVTLDPGLVFLSATDPLGTCTKAGHVITCTLGTIAPTGVAVVSIRAEGDVLGALTATGVVSDTNGDFNAANNTDAETITVINSDGCTIIGTFAADVLVGTNASDVICGLAGNDTITDPKGNDTLVGGTGNDSLNGGNGNDTITGDPIGSDPGNDTLTGGNGNDTLEGTDGVSGNDVLNGNGGTDTCTADSGDTITNCP